MTAGADDAQSGAGAGAGPAGATGAACQTGAAGGAGGEYAGGWGAGGASGITGAGGSGTNGAVGSCMGGGGDHAPHCGVGSGAGSAGIPPLVSSDMSTPLLRFRRGSSIAGGSVRLLSEVFTSNPRIRMHHSQKDGALVDSTTSTQPPHNAIAAVSPHETPARSTLGEDCRRASRPGPVAPTSATHAAECRLRDHGRGSVVALVTCRKTTG